MCVVVIFHHKWLDGRSSPQAIEVVVRGIAREQNTTQKIERRTHDFTWKFLTGKNMGREKSFTIILNLQGL